MKGQEVVMVSLEGRVAEYYLCFVTFAVTYMLPGGNGTVLIKILDKEHNTITPSQLENPEPLVELLGHCPCPHQFVSWFDSANVLHNTHKLHSCNLPNELSGGLNWTRM